MKLLIYEWTSYFQQDLYEICNEMGISYEIFSWKFADKNEDEAFEVWFSLNIEPQNFDALFSVNYYPLLSKMCMVKNIPYIAWCYDNPLNVEKIEQTLGNACNHVFLYDRIQYQKYFDMGFDTVYHLPIGVNKTRFLSLTISAMDREQYGADVSFIGQLYNSRYYDILAPLSEYTKGYMEGLLNVQAPVYGFFMLESLVDDTLIESINAQYLEKNPDLKFRVNKEALLFAMASELTRRDRMILLNLLGKRFDTRFYSYEDHELLQNVKKCGPLDYRREMPKMFASSKINLNPSLRIIQSGIPQRAFDIMASGGFLLSNYQEELAEYYVNEEEMVMYDSYPDALDKATFYLQHEELRQKIAVKGREKTLENFTMQDCLKTIFLTCGLI